MTSATRPSQTEPERKSKCRQIRNIALNQNSLATVKGEGDETQRSLLTHEPHIRSLRSNRGAHEFSVHPTYSAVLRKNAVRTLWRCQISFVKTRISC